MQKEKCKEGWVVSGVVGARVSKGWESCCVIVLWTRMAELKRERRNDHAMDLKAEYDDVVERERILQLYGPWFYLTRRLWLGDYSYRIRQFFRRGRWVNEDIGELKLLYHFWNVLNRSHNARVLDRPTILYRGMDFTDQNERAGVDLSQFTQIGERFSNILLNWTRSTEVAISISADVQNSETIAEYKRIKRILNETKKEKRDELNTFIRELKRRRRMQRKTKRRT